MCSNSKKVLNYIGGVFFFFCICINILFINMYVNKINKSYAITYKEVEIIENKSDLIYNGNHQYPNVFAVDENGNIVDNIINSEYYVFNNNAYNICSSTIECGKYKVKYSLKEGYVLKTNSINFCDYEIIKGENDTRLIVADSSTTSTWYSKVIIILSNIGEPLSFKAYNCDEILTKENLSDLDNTSNNKISNKLNTMLGSINECYGTSYSSDKTINILNNYKSKYQYFYSYIIVQNEAIFSFPVSISMAESKNYKSLNKSCEIYNFTELGTGDIEIFDKTKNNINYVCNYKVGDKDTIYLPYFKGYENSLIMANTNVITNNGTIVDGIKYTCTIDKYPNSVIDAYKIDMLFIDSGIKTVNFVFKNDDFNGTKHVQTLLLNIGRRDIKIKIENICAFVDDILSPPKYTVDYIGMDNSALNLIGEAGVEITTLRTINAIKTYVTPTITLNKNKYIIKQSFGLFEIKKKIVTYSKKDILVICNDLEYTGADIIPSMQVLVNNEPTGFTIKSISDTKKVGVVTVKILFNEIQYLDNGQEYYEFTFSILPNNLTNKTVKINYEKNYGYTDSEITPNVTSIIYNNKTLIKDVDYILSPVKLPSDSLSLNYLVQFIGNYTGEKIITINILPVLYSAKDFSIKYEPLYYSGKNQNLVFDLFYKGTKINKCYYKIGKLNLVEVANYTVVATFNTMYEGVGSFNIKIDKYSYQNTSQNKLKITVDNNNLIYSKSPLTPNVDVEFAIDGEKINKTLIEDVDYIVTYKNNINAGKGIVEVVFLDSSNYSGKAVVEFNIFKADFDLSKINLQVVKLKYNAENYLAQLNINNYLPEIATFEYFNVTNNEPNCYVLQKIECLENSGVYKIAIVPRSNNYEYKYGNTNYIIQNVIIDRYSYSINKSPRIMLNVLEQNQIYDNTLKTPQIQILFDDKVIPSSEYSVVYTNNLNAGVAGIEAVFKSGSNYEGVINATFNISKATYDISKVAFETTIFEYDRVDYLPSLKINQILPNNTKLNYYIVNIVNLEEQLGALNSLVNAGTYNIAIMPINNNYEFNNVGKNYITCFVSINKYQYIDNGKLKVSLIEDFLIYNGQEKTPQINVAFKNNELQKNIDYKTSYLNNINSGNATAIIEFNVNSNYSGKVNVSFKILKADYTNIVHKDIDVKYHKGLTTNDIKLDKFYRFCTNIDLVVGKNSINAKYLKDKINYNEYSLTICINVTKGDYNEEYVNNILSQTVFENTITYGANRKLSDIKLPLNFYFKESDCLLKVGDVGEKTYFLRYNDDIKNFNDYENTNLKIKIIVTKADYTNIVHKDIDVKYHKGLTTNDITLDDFYTFCTCVDLVFGKNIINAKYLKDEKNYNEYSLTICINVTKGDYTEKYVNDILSKTGFENTITYDFNKKLSNIILPNYFEWVDNGVIPSVNVSNYQAIFNDDSKNFNNYKINILISVEPREITNITIKATEITYEDPLSKSILTCDNPTGANGNCIYVDGKREEIDGKIEWINKDKILTGGSHRESIKFKLKNLNYKEYCELKTVVVKKKEFIINIANYDKKKNKIYKNENFLSLNNVLGNNENTSENNYNFPKDTYFKYKTTNEKLVNINEIKNVGIYKIEIVPFNLNYKLVKSVISESNAMAGEEKKLISKNLELTENDLVIEFTVSPQPIKIEVLNKTKFYGEECCKFSTSYYKIINDLYGCDLNITINCDVKKDSPKGEYNIDIFYNQENKNFDVTVKKGIYSVLAYKGNNSQVSAIQKDISELNLTTNKDVLYVVNSKISQLNIPSSIQYVLKITLNGEETTNFEKAGNYSVKIKFLNDNYYLENDTITFTVKGDYTTYIYISIIAGILLCLIITFVGLIIRNQKAEKKY